MADGRFAPSPTGPLHLGNLRTALLAWMLARAARSRLLIRVEDLDAGRVRAGAETAALADLTALGLDWDGPVTRQSERGERYRAALAQLDAAGRLYPCYCTRAEIQAAVSAPHGPSPGYPGTCRTLTAVQRRQHERSGRVPALRLRTGGGRRAFVDRLAGPSVGPVDDIVVRRNDGAPAYHLAVVVDDAAQGVEEVVRGADLLEATAAQLELAAALGLPAPLHAHVPLVLGPDGRRLAKRHGAASLGALTAAGHPPAAVRGLLAASVGLADAGESPSPRELVARCRAGRLRLSPWVVDPALLAHPAISRGVPPPRR